MMDSSLSDSIGAETAERGGRVWGGGPAYSRAGVIPVLTGADPGVSDDRTRRLSNVGKISGNPNLARGGRVHILFPPCLVV